MPLEQALIDILRALHLVCFAAGMGAGLFCDWREFQTINTPIRAADVETLERFHKWIAWAFGCMWITGTALIYIRTGFDLQVFSPKLWIKIAVVVVMTINAYAIGKIVFPLLKNNLGRPMTALSIGKQALVTQLAIISMFGWTAGLLLGSSVVLKTAPWEVLIPLAAGWFVVLTAIGQAGLFFMRSKTAGPEQTA